MKYHVGYVKLEIDVHVINSMCVITSMSAAAGRMYIKLPGFNSAVYAIIFLLQADLSSVHTLNVYFTSTGWYQYVILPVYIIHKVIKGYRSCMTHSEVCSVCYII